MPHPIENIMKTTMEELKQMVDVNTIVGDPIVTTDGSMILPVSRVCLGFVSGGGEYGRSAAAAKRAENMETDGDARYPFAGASSAGISLTPMAFLIVRDDCVKLLPAHYSCTYDRIIEMVPQAIVEIQRMMKKGSAGDVASNAGADQASSQPSPPAPNVTAVP